MAVYAAGSTKFPMYSMDMGIMVMDVEGTDGRDWGEDQVGSLDF